MRASQPVARSDMRDAKRIGTCEPGPDEPGGERGIVAAPTDLPGAGASVMRRSCLHGARGEGEWASGPASPPRVVARRRRATPGLCALAALAIAACGDSRPKRTAAVEPGVQRGLATWYGGELHGGPTASGERFDKRKLTAAHRTLRLGTRVRVTNTRNGRSVEVRINDRGPFGSRKRIIDVSEAAARQLGMIEAGVVPVTVEVLP
jgi:rare lipoprotein A